MAGIAATAIACAANAAAAFTANIATAKAKRAACDANNNLVYQGCLGNPIVVLPAEG